MATPNAATPAPTPAAKGPETPPPPVPAVTPETSEAPDQTSEQPTAGKPANSIEAEIAASFGDEWAKFSPKVRDRLVAGEMKSREADKRMQLAAKLKKDLDMTNAQVGQLFDALKRDPWKVLSNPALGHDVRKLAEEYVWQMIQEQRMTPEQREAMQAKTELAALKAEKEGNEKARQQQEMEALMAQRRAYWEKTIAEAIDTEKLPKTSYVVRRFAEYIRAASKARTPADMPAIASQIKEELVELQSKFLLPPKGTTETDEQYEERVLNSAPNDYVKLLRKADLKRLRAKGLAPKPGPKSASVSPAKPNSKISMTDWLNQREQRMGRT